MINYALTRGAKVGNGNNQEKLSQSKRLKYLVCFELQGKPFPWNLNVGLLFCASQGRTERNTCIFINHISKAQILTE